jgi:hypothetical protein
VVGIEPDGAHIPHLWLNSAYSPHHLNEHVTITYGLLIIKRGNIFFDLIVVLVGRFAHGQL